MFPIRALSTNLRLTEHTQFLQSCPRPRGLAFDKAGNIFAGTLDTAFHDNQGRILKFRQTEVSPFFATGNGPEGITFHNENGNLFAALD